jgi:hypothetical protein
MDNHLFVTAAQVCAGLAAILTVATLIAWIRQVAIRFALVGYTGFALVLTIGCFALSLGPIMQTSIPGAARYTPVYDRGSDQAVIVVSPAITPEVLELTLKQAAQNLFSSGRYSSGSPLFTLRARTVIHPETGVSLVVYLGQLEQPFGRTSQDSHQQITLYPEAFDYLSAFLKSDSKTLS